VSRTRARRAIVTGEPRPPRARCSMTCWPSLQSAARDSPAGCHEVRQIRRLVQARVLGLDPGLQRLRLPRPDRPHRRRQARKRDRGGKLLLAFRDPWRLVVLESPTAAVTARILVPPGSLRADLERADDRGFAIEEQEFRLGVRAIAAPVRGLDGEVVAALALSSAQRRQRWWATTSPSQARPPSYRLGCGGTSRDGSPRPSEPRSISPVGGRTQRAGSCSAPVAVRLAQTDTVAGTRWPWGLLQGRRGRSAQEPLGGPEHDRGDDQRRDAVGALNAVVRITTPAIAVKTKAARSVRMCW
jgi:hypothetical protein